MVANKNRVQAGSSRCPGSGNHLLHARPYIAGLVSAGDWDSDLQAFSLWDPANLIIAEELNKSVQQIAILFSDFNIKSNTKNNTKSDWESDNKYGLMVNF